MSKKSEDKERKEKTELFKRLFLEDRDSPEKKAREFADLVAGKHKRSKNAISDKPWKGPDSTESLSSGWGRPMGLDEAREFMKDPFDSKGWAESKEWKKTEEPEIIEMVIAEPSDEELQNFWASQKSDDE